MSPVFNRDQLDVEYRSIRDYVGRHEVRAEIIETEVVKPLLKRITKYLRDSKNAYLEYMKDASLGVGK